MMPRGKEQQQPTDHFLQRFLTESDKLDGRFRLTERLGLSGEKRLFALAFLQKRLLKTRIYEISTLLKNPAVPLVIKRLPLVKGLPNALDRINEQHQRRLKELEEAIKISLAMNLMGFTFSEALEKIKDGETELTRDYLTDRGMEKIHTIRTIELAINDLFAQATYQFQPGTRPIFNPSKELLKKWAERWSKQFSTPEE